MTDLHKAIKDALCKVVERLGIDRELLAVIGSYGDTMEDVQVLAALGIQRRSAFWERQSTKRELFTVIDGDK
jgi:hypothetical protein